jgi:ankyrin repeat protein
MRGIVIADEVTKASFPRTGRPTQSTQTIAIPVSRKERMTRPIVPIAVLGLFAVAAAPAFAQDLLTAARTGDGATALRLLEAGADPNVDRAAYSPLMFAAGNGDDALTAALIARGARVDHRDHNGDRALLWAAQRGRVGAVRLLLAAGAALQSDDDPYRITPLMQASRHGHVEVAQILLKAGADPNRRDHVDDTALHGAALARSPAVTALLLQAGADPNVVGKYLLMTPLHVAATYGNVDTVRALIAARAGLEARDHKGRTPLAVAAALDSAPVVGALLEGGADPDARDAEGITPFIAAVGRSGASAGLLVDLTRDIDRGFAAAVWGGHAALALRLAKRGADVNAVDQRGLPAVAGAAQHSDPAMLQWFLANGVDLGRHGAAALHQAAAAGRADLARLLLDAKVPVDVRDDAGATPLLRGAGDGHVDMVRLLLERGADRDPRDRRGRGIDAYMATAIDGIALQIARRKASRAWRPTAHLEAQLGDLRERHAAIGKLLAQ